MNKHIIGLVAEGVPWYDIREDYPSVPIEFLTKARQVFESYRWAKEDLELARARVREREINFEEARNLWELFQEGYNERA